MLQVEVDAVLRASHKQFLISLSQAPAMASQDNFEQAENLGQEQISAERKEAERHFNQVGAQTPDEVVDA